MFCVAYMNECIPATATEPGIFRWDDLDYIKRRIDEIKAKCRWCIIIAHGGEEFAALPTSYTRDRYLKYIGFGADIVFAHRKREFSYQSSADFGKRNVRWRIGCFSRVSDRGHQKTAR